MNPPDRLTAVEDDRLIAALVRWRDDPEATDDDFREVVTDILAARQRPEAVIAAEALREAADEFEAEQRRKTRERQELHVWSVACHWLRDRAARLAEPTPDGAS